MGLAKHHEKILEIVFERMDMMENRKYKSEIKVICSAQSTPHSKVSVKIHNECQADSSKTEQKYKDKYITCRNCGKEFVFSARSQKFFASKKWNAPKRCKCCRDSIDFTDVRYLMRASF